MNDLEALIARAKYLLLDFDGPVCQVYAGLPQPGVSSGASHALRYSCKALTNGRHSCGTAHGLYLWAQRQASQGWAARREEPHLRAKYPSIWSLGAWPFTGEPRGNCAAQSVAAICTYVPGSNGPGSEKPPIDSTFA